MMYKCRALSRFGRAGWQNEAIKGIHTRVILGRDLGEGAGASEGERVPAGQAVEDGVSQFGADPVGGGSPDLRSFITTRQSSVAAQQGAATATATATAAAGAEAARRVARSPRRVALRRPARR